MTRSTSTTSSVKTTAWRVVASKSLLFFGLAAGVGQDTYDHRRTIGAHIGARTVPPAPASNAGPIAISQKITRTNMFANVSFNLLLLKLVGEIGQVIAVATIDTFNTFGGKRADSRIVRIGRSSFRVLDDPRGRGRYMRRALALAEQGGDRRRRTRWSAPSSFATARIVGEGYHARFGEAHAEVDALARRASVRAARRSTSRSSRARTTARRRRAPTRSSPPAFRAS